MSSSLKNLTWEDIRDLPEDAGRTEIIDGELYLAPAPSENHQRVATALGAAIYPHVRRLGLGEFYSTPVHVILAPNVSFEPDLCFISEDRRGIIRNSVIEGTPDLMIEILSERNRCHDTVLKLEYYEKYGVAEYWIVDPYNERIEIRNLENGRYSQAAEYRPGRRLRSRVIDGLELDPAEIF